MAKKERVRLCKSCRKQRTRHASSLCVFCRGDDAPRIKLIKQNMVTHERRETTKMWDDEVGGLGVNVDTD